MVSDEPSITDASFPVYESTPETSKIFFIIASAPEPDTGFRSASGSTSVGNENLFNMGESILAKKSKSPDALTMDTATTSPTRAGKIPMQVEIPCFAPENCR